MSGHITHSVKLKSCSFISSRSNADGETIVKTTSDFWVVGKKSDQREFYVVINQKNANLIEINGKIHTYTGTHTL